MRNEKGPPAVTRCDPPETGQLGGPTKTENRPIGASAQQRRKLIDEPQLFVALSDGRSRVGYLIQRGHGFEAVMPDGESLGLYNDEAAAARAVIARSKPVELRSIADGGGPR